MTQVTVTITTQVGVDEDDNPILEVVDGYHVDSLAPIEGADDFLTTPATPQHGFLGVPLGDVYRYKFNDEAHYHEFVPQVDDE